MKNNILSIEQDIGFFIKKAKEKQDDGNYFDAIKMYNRALEVSPDNISVMILKAELLQDMKLYKQSNDLLFKACDHSKDMPENFCFLLSENYFALDDYELGFVFFKMFATATNKPLPEEVDEEFLNFVESFEEMDIDEILEDQKVSTENIAKSYVSRALYFFERREFDKVADQLEFARSYYPTSDEVLNVIAQMYFNIGFYDEAIKVCKQSSANNIRADIIKALCLFEKNDIEDATLIIKDILKTKTKKLSKNENYLFAICLFKIKEYGFAQNYVQKLIQKNPYNFEYLHLAAVINAKLGKVDDANYLWNKIYLLDNDNTVAKFYKDLDLIKNDLDNYKIPERFIIPESVTDRWQENIKYAYQNNAALPKNYQQIIDWAIEYGGTELRDIAFKIMKNTNYYCSIITLKRFLLESENPDDLKRTVIEILDRMNVPQPYIMLNRTGLKECSAFAVPADLPDEYNIVAKGIIGDPTIKSNKTYLQTAKQIWTDFMNAQRQSYLKGTFDVTDRPEIFVAAVEYIVLKKMNTTTQKDIAKKYNVNISNLREAIKIIKLQINLVIKG